MADTSAAFPTVTRYALLMRRPDGRGELLGTIYRSEVEAQAAGVYWQAHSQRNESAEIVSFSVPIRGAPVGDAGDFLPYERAGVGAGRTDTRCSNNALRC